MTLTAGSPTIEAFEFLAGTCAPTTVILVAESMAPCQRCPW